MRENTKKTTKRPVKEEIDEPVDSREQSGFFSSRISIILIALVALAFIVYSLISLAGIHSQISERQEELNGIKDEITVQEIKNDAMSKTYNLTDAERSEYMERLARDELDYVKDGERVFVNVSGE